MNSLITLSAIFSQSLLYYLFECWWDVVVEAGNRFGLRVRNVIDRLSYRFACERQASRRHLVKNDAERKDVGAVIDVATKRLFRRHVINGPHYHAGSCFNSRS